MIPEGEVLDIMVLEFTYGGSVTHLSPTKVVIETSLIGLVDTSVFEGSEEEMAFIAKTAACYVGLWDNEGSRKILLGKAIDSLEVLSREVSGSPLYLKMMRPFLAGMPSASAALLLAVGATDTDVDSLGTISSRDLAAVVSLHREMDIPLLEVIQEVELTA